MAEWVILVGWAVTDALGATVGSVVLEGSLGSGIRVSAGTGCLSTEGSASVGRSLLEWAWVWDWDLDMVHLATRTGVMGTVVTVTRTADMVPHSVVTATPATKCALILACY